VAKTKSSTLEKKLLLCGRIASKIGLSSLKVIEAGTHIEMTFVEKDGFSTNKGKELSETDKLALKKLQEEQHLDELRILDPMEYERLLAQDQLEDTDE
jgi:hypothetical protein